MKKILLTLAVTLLFIFPLCSCGTEVPAALTGEWECQDSSYGCEAGYGYLALRIEENGHFSLYDAEAGNPGISGTMKGSADALTGTVKINCGAMILTLLPAGILKKKTHWNLKQSHRAA